MLHDGPVYGASQTRPLTQLLTIKDVQETLRISRAGVYRLIRAGQIEGVRIGSRYRFEPEEVLALIGRGRAP